MSDPNRRDVVGTAAALEILESAWSARRASFELPEGEQRAALASVRADLDRAADTLRNAGQVVHYAHALHLGAHVAMDVGDVEAAEKRWREAVSLLRSSGQPLELAHKLRHVGDLEVARGDLDEAGRHYEEALALYRDHAGSGDLSHANAVRRAALLSERRGDVEEARTLWAEARQRYVEAGLSQGVAEADEHLEGLG
ncbi:MAG: hypothetical protein HKN72_13585 [Gemmatimonadetes bacterium]|nr:hypothetical protein [Gemmatimonadota bacterium]